MITICKYTLEDCEAVGRLIAKTFGEINLAFLQEEQWGHWLKNMA